MKSTFALLRRRISEHGCLWLPVLLALLGMLPRILSAQFGWMDDGVTALNAEKMGEGILGFTDGGNSGRFRPVYWLYYSGLYRLIGVNPRLYYLLHAVLFAAIVGMVVLLVRRMGGSRLQAFLAGLLALTTGPVIENFYTLSKSEPLHAILTLAGLLLLLSLPRRTTSLGKAVTFGGATLIFITAAFAKESYAVMPFIALAWLILGWLLRKWPQGRVDLRMRTIIFTALAITGIIFLIVALPSMTVQQSDNYANRFDLDFGKLARSLIEWRAWLTRDFLFLLPVGVLGLLLFVLRKTGPAAMTMLDALVFTIAWIIAFIPWEFKAEYYLLMAGLGGAVFAGLVLGGLGVHWPALSPGWKAVSGALVLAAFYLWLTTLPNLWNNARLQLTVDRVNQQTAAFLAENVTENGTVLVNLAPGSEYPNELDLHLRYFYNRDDIQVGLFQYQTPQSSTDPVDYWLVTPTVTNKPVYSIRFGFLETALQRANRLLVDFASDPAATFTGGFDQWIVRPLQPACWVLRSVGPCQEDSRWVSRIPLEYRWSIYHWTGHWEEQSQPGVVSPDGLWQVKLADGTIGKVQFGSGAELPLTGDVDGDGRSDLGIFNPVDGIWQFDTNLDGIAELSLTVPETGPDIWPLLGDWDGDGRSSPAVFDRAAAGWRFYDEKSQLQQALQAGLPGDIPLAGDWNGDGRDTIGVYRLDSGEVDLENELSGSLTGVDFYAPKSSLPVAGHWAGLPLETLAFFSDGAWQPYYWNRDGEPVLLPAGFPLGAAGDRPVVGRW